MDIRIHMVEIALQESLEVIGFIQRPRESTSFTSLDLETKNYTKILKNKKVRVFYFLQKILVFLNLFLVPKI